jgi:hypothetical protein
VDALVKLGDTLFVDAQCSKVEYCRPARDDALRPVSTLVVGVLEARYSIINVRFWACFRERS